MATKGVCSHDDIAFVKHSHADRAVRPSSGGWESTPRPASRQRRFSRRLGTLLLLLPLVVGVLGAPAAPSGVRADDLSDAQARAAQLQAQDMAAQQAQVAQINCPPERPGIRDQEHDTPAQGHQLRPDRRSRHNINDMQDKIDVIKADYTDLVAQVQGLDATLMVVAAREEAKRGHLADRQGTPRRAHAQRLRPDRTSLLEIVPVGGIVHRRSCPRSATTSTSATRTRRWPTRSPSTRRRWPRSTRRPRTPAPGSGRPAAARQPPRSGRSTRAWPRCNAAKAQLKALQKRRGRVARAAEEGLPDQLERNKAAAPRRRSPRPRRRRRGCSPRSPADRQADAERQHPVAVQRHARRGRWRARSPRSSGAPASHGSRPSATAPTTTRASTSWRRTDTPIHAAGDGAVVYIGWTTPTAPTRPGS